MPRQEYQDRLDDLQTEVVEYANLVLERYRESLVLFETGDSDQADAIIEGDHEINDWYLELESTCIELIALQQPVASDLRLITASFKIITDLERIADLATNLARYARETAGQPSPSVPIEDLGSRAETMVANAMNAYQTADADQCWDIAAMDDELDAACEVAAEEIVRDLLTQEGWPENDHRIAAHIDSISRALVIIRDIERVGDHAVNISARTLWMIENDDTLIY